MILICSEHHETSLRLGTLVFVQMRSYTLRYVHHEPMFFVAMVYDNDGDFFLLSRLKMITIWYNSTPQYIHLARLTILNVAQRGVCHSNIDPD